MHLEPHHQLTPLNLPIMIFKSLLLSFTLTLAAGHTFLTQPDAYNRVFQLRDCRGKECLQACPSLLADPKDMPNTPLRPARVWKRNQKVWIRWARNNHATGFIRFSIVPVNVMMSRRWHTRLAVYHGCFAQGAFSCRGEQQCGADLSRQAYQRRITIPTIFPDGDYVFAMVWFGGARGPINQAPKFSDYFTCSFIRIRGGPLKGGYQPFFDPGDVVVFPTTQEGKCLAAVDAPGVCHKNGCRRKALWQRPRKYKRKGKLSDKLNIFDVVQARRA